MASVLPLLMLASPVAAMLPPVGTTAAYEVRTYTSQRHAPGDPSMFISHGDGVLPRFRLTRLRNGRSGPRFEIGSAYGHHDRYPEGLLFEAGASASERRARAHQQLERSLDYHRPFALIERGGSGWTVSEHPAAAYERCAIRTARASARRVEAMADDPNEKKQWRRFGRRSPLGHDQWNGFEWRGPRRLLDLLSLAAPAFADGPVLESARKQPVKTLSAEEDYHAWLDRMKIAYGREFRRESHASGSDAASRLCRTLKPEKLDRSISGTCSFGGVVDARDGWPLTVSLAREQKSRRGAQSSAGMLFYRLAPKAQFAPPPNPCASVYRRNPAPARGEAQR